MKIKTIDFIFFTTLISLIILYFSSFPLNVDSTWILHCANKIVNGSTMYIDMIDVNPPLIFIYSTIAIFISKLLTISIINSYILLVIILITISIFLCWSILKKVKLKNKNAKRYYLYLISLILSIFITYNFGEREHLLMIFIFPYLLMMTYKKEENLKSSTFLQISIAVFAALGFNLKPHFFLIFISIEFMYMYSQKNLLYIFRKDSLIIIASAILYIILIYYAFPEYINFMIPFAVETYSDVFNKPLNILFINYELILLFLTLILFMFLSKRKISFSDKIILITILSTIVIYLVQQKGWSYHRLPIYTLTLLFIIHIIIYKSLKYKTFFISLIPFIFFIAYYNTVTVYNFDSLKKIINKIPAENSVLIVSTDIAQGQPLLKTTHIWASRFPSLFMLPSIIYDKNKSVKEYTFNSIYSDLIKYQPNNIIFPSGNNSFNYYNFYITESPKIKEFYSKYYKIEKKGNYIILTKHKEIK